MSNRIIAVLDNRKFALLFLSEVFSQIAFNMMNFILLILAFKLSNSNTAVSLIVLTFTVPAIFFGILAGAYVDRWNKKSVLFWTNILRFAVLMALAFFSQDLFVIYILSFITAFITQFFIPAETPVIPLLVKKNQLLSANALFGMGIYGSILVAYATSGAFLSFFGDRNVFIFLSFFFILAAIFISVLKIPKKRDKETLKVDIGLEIKLALNLIAKTKEIYQALFLITLSQTIILVLAVLGPGFAKQVLEIELNDLPLIFIAPAALGMIVGAVFIGNFLHNFLKRTMAQMGVLIGGICIFLLPYGSKIASKDFISLVNNFLPPALNISILHLVIFLAFILGVANSLIFVPSNTVLQERTSDETRGKIYGVLNTLAGGLSLLPIILVGKLADIFGVASVLTGIGAILIFIGIVLKLKIIK